MTAVALELEHGATHGKDFCPEVIPSIVDLAVSIRAIRYHEFSAWLACSHTGLCGRTTRENRKMTRLAVGVK